MQIPKRRSRMVGQRSGKRLELTQRDLGIFLRLHQYRYLRSSYLYAFTGGRSVTRFKERLGDLLHEGYLGRPTEQWRFSDGRHSPGVYQLRKGAPNLVAAPGEERTWLSANPR